MNALSTTGKVLAVHFVEIMKIEMMLRVMVDGGHHTATTHIPSNYLQKNVPVVQIQIKHKTLQK